MNTGCVTFRYQRELTSLPLEFVEKITWALEQEGNRIDVYGFVHARLRSPEDLHEVFKVEDIEALCESLGVTKEKIIYWLKKC